MPHLAELIVPGDLPRVPMNVLVELEETVRERQLNESSGHDWWHTSRVVRLALRIGETEGGDQLVVYLAALLHDIADHKFHDGDEEIGPRTAAELLSARDVDPAIIAPVREIIATLSFKGAGVATSMTTLEGKIVQDADRLDAIGALGVGRAFAYGGKAGRAMHDPTAAPVMHGSFEAYRNATGTTVNHFYEKLLLLGERMNTTSGRAVAQRRMTVMEDFLAEFLREWDGDDALVPSVAEQSAH